MASGLEEKIKAARELCDKGLWPDVLAFARKWHAENPAEPKALFFQGVALAATGRFVEAETDLSPRAEAGRGGFQDVEQSRGGFV